MNINIETSLRKAMSLLMRLHEEWNSLVTGGKSGDISSIGEESIELWRDCENTLRLEIAAKGYASDGKNLLYDEIFLFDLCAQIRKIADVLRLFMDNPELANSVREGE
jgi:hypothetical protein